MPNTKEKGKLIEVLSKHIPYGYATLCLIADELMADGVRLEEKRATSDGCITMAVKEKLVELVIKAQYRCGNTLCHGCEQLADSLIEAGVTIPVQGRWVKHNFLGHEQWVCSECQTLGSPQWKRCPVCEAKMPQPPKGE